MANHPQFYVEVVKFGPREEIVKRLGPHDQRRAEKIEHGLMQNLNHEDYFTRIVEEPSVSRG